MRVGSYVWILWHVNKRVAMLAAIFFFSSSGHHLRYDDIDGDDLKFGKDGESDIDMRFVSFEVQP